ncbi:MAG: serine/threonine-protein kinase [Planctomycetota bacterium]
MSQAKLVGQYELLDELGEGAAGVAYRARHHETGEPVAIKLLHAELDGDIELQRRFVREVSVLQRLEHPNIVGHKDCGLHDDKLYFAMELVDSGTLDQVLRQRGALPWRLATEVAIKVCRALSHAHAEGVIHRDLKPANLFLSAEGEVKVGDFGLARDLNQHRLTVEGQTVGTCRFMAPEQVQGQADLTGAVDLYALGCLLFQMVVGQPPFDGTTIVEVFEKHLFAERPRLSEKAPGVPAALDEVVQRLLAQDPEDRPADADRVIVLLEAVLAGEPLPARPADEPEQNLTEQLTSPPEAGNPNVALAAGLVGAAAIFGVLAWLLFGQN